MILSNNRPCKHLYTALAAFVPVLFPAENLQRRDAMDVPEHPDDCEGRRDKTGDTTRRGGGDHWHPGCREHSPDKDRRGTANDRSSPSEEESLPRDEPEDCRPRPSQSLERGEMLAFLRIREHEQLGILDRAECKDQRANDEMVGFCLRSNVPAKDRQVERSAESGGDKGNETEDHHPDGEHGHRQE